ncbi:dUTP diphosphatase (plasmid) [Bacillus carboniphilus]|uniref:dUTP diphosphatase n=1 Tax=Bacillus carboniphilus TaxID=86663 RepID=A0ABY9JYC4_9BACI|nr:dUTP diphosphatase [Bacillus carboniphilus]WLR44409.1 dUTP diphosphatase [Bacillus carboniphilus]
MNVKELFEMQRELDQHIMDKHPELKEADNLYWKVLALQVELGELAQEFRGFKMWSNNREMNREKALEEYVDCLHFVISIGLDLGHSNFHKHLSYAVVGGKRVNELIIREFNEVFSASARVQYTGDYEYLTRSFANLGALLGFQWSEIEQAYKSKNQVNHARQEANY